MRYIFSVTLSFVVMSFLNAQSSDWVEQMQDPSVNFYQVQQTFDQYWEGKEVEKGKGWKQFKRWEAFTEERVFPDGERPYPAILANEFSAVNQAQINSNTGLWTPQGPFNGNPIDGVGRINRIVIDPNNSQTIWACAPAGGLWKSTDAGLTWSTNTDLLPNLGVSDVAIDPTNTQIMYMATGDRDAGDTYSYGVLKSTDGGQTWNTTGLTDNVTQQRRISDLYINPDNTSIVLASTRNGIYRSTDAGVTWTLTQNGVFNEIVQMPGNSDVLYNSTIISSSSDVWKSTNNGISWTQITNAGLPSSGARRIELAVSAQDSNYVYALMANSASGFLGLYRSTDAGASWSTQATSPNLLGWSTAGSDAGGQGWYDLALAVNPTDKDDLYVGGVNVWRSTDGGLSWNLNGHWFGGGGAPFIHADIHDLEFLDDGSALYSGNDGGVYRRNDGVNSWTSLNDGMNITQYYRISSDGTDTTLMLAGAQDNGTHMLDNGSWDDVLGGDGMDCALDPTNPSVMYASSQYGNFRKSNNRGNSFNASFGLSSTVRGTGAWVTPIRVDQLHPDTLYIGYTQLYRSFDAGINFTAVGPSNLAGGDNLDQIAISPTQTNVLYVAEGNDLWRSEDYGNTYTNLSSNVVSSRTITQITVAPDDPMHVFITHSGYTSGQKIYESKNGGASWVNISLNLPNVPANTVAIENNAAMSMYVGTDLGVFYKDVNLSQWVPYNSGLPNVVVNDLEINYHDRTLRAGTYGRGVWFSPLYSDITAPLASFDLPHAVCDGDTITLSDNSFYNPNTWSWTISPNTITYVNGTSSNSQNPEIVFSQTGVYSITLSVTNSQGSNSTTVNSTFAIGGLPLPFSEDFEDDNSLDSWRMNPFSDDDWTREIVGGTAQASYAIKADLFYNSSGPYNIITPNLDFRDHDSTKLSFDYAYSGRLINSDDTLKIYVATNCDDNWTLVQTFTEDGSNNFATTASTNFVFSPASSTDWCGNPGFGQCLEVDLSAYANTEGVRVMFQAASAGGNNLFIDNIEITGQPNTAPTANFTGPQTACALSPVSFIDQSYGSPVSYEWTFNGGTPSISTDKNPTVVFAAAGTYNVKLKVINLIGSDSITKSSFITIDPADTVQVSLSAISTALCASDTLMVTANIINGGSNSTIDWYLNGSMVSSGISNYYEFSNLSNTDEIYAIVQSSEVCAYPQQLISDTIVANILPPTSIQITSTSGLCSSDASVSLSATPSGGTFSGFAVNNGFFDPNVAGAGNHIITYDYTDGNGCSFSDQTTIVVSSAPVLSINSVPDVCEGEDPFFLNQASPVGGSFSGPGVRSDHFFADSAGIGTHTITYTFTAGSCSPVSISTTVTVVPNPAQPTISLQGSALVASGSANSYQWYRNGNAIGGATSNTYTPTLSDTYSVEALDASGCSSAASIDFTYNIGLENLSNVLRFDLYPNPATNEIVVELETQSAIDAKLNIVNSVGQLVLSKGLEKQIKLTNKLDISQLPSGIYIISIDGNDTKVRRTFVIQ